MGCVSSKVGQKPPEETTAGHTAHEDARGESRAVESRAAQPVAKPSGESKVPSRKAKGIGKGRPQEQAIYSEGASRRMNGGEEEAAGETVTDATGLQMRTPRTCTDRGLHYAAKSGDLPLVHKLLGNSTGSESRTQDESSPGRTVPRTSVAADLDERGMWGNTPLLVATQYAHPHVALALIAGGANTCLENERRATALHFSCAEGLLEVGRALLDNGADVDPPVAAVHHPAVNGGQTVPVTPLSAASSGGHTELVRLLVERGAEVDRRVSPKGADGQDRRSSFSEADGVGGTALTAAARYGHTETCLLLIDNGASILLEDWDSRTPLLHAILGGHTGTSLVLLDVARKTGCVRQLAEPGGLGISCINPSRLTPLHAACDNGLHKVVKVLLAARAQVDSRDGMGATPLLCACRKGQLQCVQELLSRGADPMAEDNRGSTPLSAAQSRTECSGGEEIARLIEAAIAGPKARREDQPQHQAPQQGCEDEHEGEDEDEDEDEDVLLVSDWDDNVEGVDVLNDCNVVDGDGDGSRHRLDHTDRDISAKREAERRHAAEGQGRLTNTTNGSHPAGGSEDEDVDVLLVGDYDPMEEEAEAGLAGMPSPPAGSGSRRGSVGSREARSLSAGSIPRAQQSLASPGTATTSAVDGTVRHPDEKGEDDREQLRSSGPEAGAGKDGTKRDLDEAAAGLEIRPQGLSHGMLPPLAVQRGLHHQHHDLKPRDLTARLSTHQVAADSVGMVLATAADRIVVGQPAGGG